MTKRKNPRREWWVTTETKAREAAEKARLAAIRAEGFGVIPFDPRNMYPRASVVKEFKNEKAAEKYAQKLNEQPGAPARGYVVRQLHYMHNPRVRNAPGRARSNPAAGKPRLIYTRLGSIEAQKDPRGRDNHPCGAACKRARHWYRHKFKPGSRVYGYPNGTLVIKKG